MLANLPREFMVLQNGIRVPSCPLASVKFLVKCNTYYLSPLLLKPYVMLISVSFLTGILFSTNIPSLIKAHILFSIYFVSLISPPLYFISQYLQSLPLSPYGPLTQLENLQVTKALRNTRKCCPLMES